MRVKQVPQVFIDGTHVSGGFSGLQQALAQEHMMRSYKSEYEYTEGDGYAVEYEVIRNPHSTIASSDHLVGTDNVEVDLTTDLIQE